MLVAVVVMVVVTLVLSVVVRVNVTDVVADVVGDVRSQSVKPPARCASIMEFAACANTAHCEIDFGLKNPARSHASSTGLPKWNLASVAASAALAAPHWDPAPRK